MKGKKHISIADKTIGAVVKTEGIKTPTKRQKQPPKDATSLKKNNNQPPNDSTVLKKNEQPPNDAFTRKKNNQPHLGRLKKNTRKLVQKRISDLDEAVVANFETVLSKSKISLNDIKASIQPVGGELLSSTIKEGKKGIKPKKNHTIDRRTLPKALRKAYITAMENDELEKNNKIMELMSKPETISSADWLKIVELDKKKPLQDKF